MRFASEGYPFIAVALVLAALGWVVWALGSVGLAGQILAPVLTVLALFTLWFFRDPERHIPTEPAVVVAPGEGRILLVEEVDEPTYLGGRARKITIFLSVFDIHVQRSPVAGRVEHRVYRPGTFAVAWLDKASEDNERASLGIATPHGRVLVRQIAGLIARRIVTYPVEGQDVARGERIGIIRFGSRVDLFLPLDWEVTCAPGDRVVAGLTILARQPAGSGS
ncbi:MAG TPA: phosphatidylserine decarboxylase family protein [Longimicrobiales bacterium]|nr:phosphatidylserine decarboxylase family protein [Longimicrobiales bacterium]